MPRVTLHLFSNAGIRLHWFLTVGASPAVFLAQKKKITLLKIGFNTLYYLSGSPINREICNIFGMKNATFQLFRTQLTVPSLRIPYCFTMPSSFPKHTTVIRIISSSGKCKPKITSTYCSTTMTIKHSLKR